MPIYFQKETDFAKIGIWKITEDYSKLLRALEISGEELERLQSFGSYHRKLQFLATRALLHRFVDINVSIEYDNNGNPSLSNGMDISISHSNKWVAIIISQNNVGVDIEVINDKINKVQSRFISAAERQKFINLDVETMYLIWSAKETMVKITNNKSYIYNKDLQIHSFTRKKEGRFAGIINKKGKKIILDFNYFFFENAEIVWSVIQ